MGFSNPAGATPTSAGQPGLFSRIAHSQFVGLLAAPFQPRSLSGTQPPSSIYIPSDDLIASLAQATPQDILARARGVELESPTGPDEAGYLYSKAREAFAQVPEGARDSAYFDGLWEAASHEIKLTPTVHRDLPGLQDALSAVAKHGEGNAFTDLQVRLTRTHLTYRIHGDRQDCIRQYGDIAIDPRLKLEDPAMYGLGWEAHVAPVNLYLEWGKANKDPRDRARAFNNAANGALSMLEGFAEKAPVGKVEHYKGQLRFMYSHVVTQLALAGCGDLAYRVYDEKLRPSAGSAEEAQARKSIAHLLDAEGKLIKPTTGQQIGAVIRQFFGGSAKYPTNAAAFGWMLGGAVAGSVVTDILAHIAGSPTNTSVLMQGAAVGAFGAYEAGHVVNASRDPRMKSALRTGYSDVTRAQAALGAGAEAGKLLLAYALWGGEVIPSQWAQHLPLIQDSSGQFAQFAGLGSVETFVHQLITNHGFELARLVVQDPANGFSQWWTGLLDQKSTFAQVVQMGGENWLKIFDPRESRTWGTNPKEHYLWFTFEMIALAYAVTTFKSGAREAILGRLGDLSLKMYKMINPKTTVKEDAFKTLAGKGFEWALLIPGIFLLSKDAAQFVGNMSDHAAVKSAVVALLIYYMLNMMRKTKPFDAPGDGALRNTWVPALFASFGGAAVDKVQVNTVGDALGVSVGLNVIYIPLIILMSLMIPLNGSQMTRQAFTRWPVLESIFTNMPRAMGLFEGFAQALGLPQGFINSWFEGGKYGSAGNTVLAELIQAFINEPASSRVYGAVDGTKIQYSGIESMTSEGKAQLVGDEKQARDLLMSAVTGGRQWDFWQFMRGENLTAILYPFTAVFVTLAGLPETFPTRPAPVYWNGLFRALNNNMPEANMNNLLSRILPNMLKAFTPETQDVYHNWFSVLWAARDGKHGASIRKFFAENDWVFDTFSVQRELPAPPSSSWYDWNFWATWHKTYLWGGNRVEHVPAA